MNSWGGWTHRQIAVGHDVKILPFAIPVVGKKHVICKYFPEGKIIKIDLLQS